MAELHIDVGNDDGHSRRWHAIAAWDRRTAVNASDRGDESMVRFPSPAAEPDQGVGLRVHATVDRDARTITYELPDKTRTTLDVVTARALQMILWEGVFNSLQPDGPCLRVERPGM